MKKEKKVIKHPILDRYTVAGMMLLTVLTFFLLIVVIGLIVGGVIGLAMAIFDIKNSDVVTTLIYVLASIIMLAIHKRWFYPEFDGCLKRNRNLGKWMLVAVLVLLALIVPDCIITLIIHAKHGAPTLPTVMTALLAGVTEEVIFRAVPASYGMRQIKEPQKIWLVTITTSLIFSLLHVANISAGAAVDSTVVQVLATFGIGAALCALFLRSGNILPPMLVHFLYDVYAIKSGGNGEITESGVIVGSMNTISLISNLIIFAVSIGVAVFLLRRSVLDDTMKLWEKKWNKNKADAELSA